VFPFIAEAHNSAHNSFLVVIELSSDCISLFAVTRRHPFSIQRAVSVLELGMRVGQTAGGELTRSIAMQQRSDFPKD
jgi:hypothetical protein